MGGWETDLHATRAALVGEWETDLHATRAPLVLKRLIDCEDADETF